MSEARHKQFEAIDFWSMSYRGHAIAVQRHRSGWLVYLNEVMQQGMVFTEARAAANWLRRKVDDKLNVAN